MEAIKAHCNDCSRKTRHKQLHVHTKDNNSFDNEALRTFEMRETLTHRLIQCMGCDSISMQVEYWHELISDVASIDVYPPRISRRSPPWISKLKREIRELLQEVYAALHSDSRRLALMGARTVLDLFMNHTIGDVGGFEAKLKRLEEKGVIASSDLQILGAALEAGHAAAHRGHNPTSTDLNYVMDIVESLLYKSVLKRTAKQLSENTPKRQKPKPI